MGVCGRGVMFLFFDLMFVVGVCLYVGRGGVRLGFIY